MSLSTHVEVSHSLSVSKAMVIKYNPMPEPEFIPTSAHPFFDLLDSPCNLENFHVLAVTPAMARVLLTLFNNRNRTLKKSRYDLYKDRMLEGSWIDANPLAPLAFFSDGNVATGQHRLAAQIASDSTISYCVAFSVSDEQRELMDEESHSRIDKLVMDFKCRSDVAKAYLETARYHTMTTYQNYGDYTITELSMFAGSTVPDSRFNKYLGDTPNALNLVKNCLDMIPGGKNVKKGLVPNGVLCAAYKYLLENHSKIEADAFVVSIHKVKDEIEPIAHFNNTCFIGLVSKLKSFSEECKSTGSVYRKMKASMKSGYRAALVGKFLQRYTEGTRLDQQMPNIGTIVR